MPFPVLLTPLSVIHFTSEDIKGCNNAGAIDAIIAPRNPLSCFFISCFTVSVAPSIDLIFLVTL